MHWRNSRFQIRYFLVGECHTPDEAYRKLRELAEERQTALDHAKAQSLRAEAKRLRAKAWWRNITRAQRLENAAVCQELDNGRAVVQDCIEVAQEELAYIMSLIDRIAPHRKFAGLPAHEADQACQREQWLEELKRRAEVFLATQGFIPHDQLTTMRQHPDFAEQILPHIKALRQAPDQAIVQPRALHFLDAPVD